MYGLDARAKTCLLSFLRMQQCVIIHLTLHEAILCVIVLLSHLKNYGHS